jgi:hypothetical protein
MGQWAEILPALERPEVQLEKILFPYVIIIDKHGVIIHQEFIMQTIAVEDKTQDQQRQGDNKRMGKMMLHETTIPQKTRPSCRETGFLKRAFLFLPGDVFRGADRGRLGIHRPVGG